MEPGPATNNGSPHPAPTTRRSPRADGRGVLFTAFEPSGDDHASAVIAELRARHPALPIYAWGGPRMEQAGATLIERTGDNAVIGLPGVGKIIEHLRIHRRVGDWLKENRAAVHVPVDSPAANFPLCRLARNAGLSVVHLVAPQVWAWASWRVNKLRKRTNLVLCLLPFEEDWFLSRAVPARFIGHPLFDEPLDDAAIAARAARIQPRTAACQTSGGPKIALMPGSRPAEMRNCLPVLLDAFRRLQKDFPGTIAVIAATRPDVAADLRRRAIEWWGSKVGHSPTAGPDTLPDGLEIVAGDTDAVIRWCDYALVVSGTVTLQIARQRKPMIAFYRPNPITYWLLIRWLLATRHVTLPNLIAGRRIIPELIPHFGDGEALAVEVIKLLRRTGYADDQREELDKVARRFDGTNAARAAADEIERMLGLRPTPAPAVHVEVPTLAADFRATSTQDASA